MATELEGSSCASATPMLRYSREEMLAMEADAMKLTLDESFKDHPILSIKALPPNAYEKDFDYDEWCKQAKNHRANRNQNRLQGRKDIPNAPMRRGSADASEIGGGKQPWQSKQNSWERGAKVIEKDENDLWDDVDQSNAGFEKLDLGLSEMASAAEKFRLEMEQMKIGRGQQPAAGTNDTKQHAPEKLSVQDQLQSVLQSSNTGASAETSIFELQPALRTENNDESPWNMPSPKLHEPSPAPQQPVQPQVDEWYYLDPQGNQQGPFKSLEMRDWFEAGYFKPNLPVRRGLVGQFSPLATTFGDNGTPFAAKSDALEQQRQQMEAQQRALEQQRQVQLQRQMEQQRLMEQQQQQQRQYQQQIEQQRMEQQHRQQQAHQQEILRQQQEQEQQRIALIKQQELETGVPAWLQQSSQSLETSSLFGAPPKDQVESPPENPILSPRDTRWDGQKSSNKSTSVKKAPENETAVANEQVPKAATDNLNQTKAAQPKQTWGSGQKQQSGGSSKSLKEIQLEEQAQRQKAKASSKVASKAAPSNANNGQLHDMGNQLKMMLGVSAKQSAPEAARPAAGWSSATDKAVQPKAKSMRDILAEEELSKKKSSKKGGGAPAPSRWSNVVAGGHANLAPAQTLMAAAAARASTNAIANKVKQQPANTPDKSQASEDDTFWNVDSKDKKPAPVSTSAPIKTAKPVTDEFMLWCESQLKKLGGGDVTILQFCSSLEDPVEIRQHLATYLGSTPAVSAFATEFIQRKTKKSSAPKKVSPTTAGGKKGRKKKGKGQKLDSSLLGYSVSSSG